MNNIKQGHHHNGDEAARRLHMMCSICVRRSTTSLFVGTYGLGWPHLVARPCIPVSSPIDTYGLSLTVFSYVARPSDSDTMTNTALEAIVSSSGKNSIPPFLIWWLWSILSPIDAQSLWQLINVGLLSFEYYDSSLYLTFPYYELDAWTLRWNV